MYIQIDLIKDNSNQISKDIQETEVRTINRMASEAKSYAIKELSQERGFPSQELDKVIKIEEASKSGLFAFIKSQSKRIPILKLGATQTSKGVQFSLGQPKEIKSAFIASMKSGHRGVFKRIGKKRLPIKELFTLSISEYLGTREMTTKIDNFIKKRLPEIFSEEMSKNG